MKMYRVVECTFVLRSRSIGDKAYAKKPVFKGNHGVSETQQADHLQKSNASPYFNSIGK
jgi:hypothetical protein